MKRRGFIKTSFALGSILAVPDFLAQPKARSASTNAVAQDLGAKTRSGMTLFFLPEQVAALKVRITADTATHVRWERFLLQADGLVTGASQRKGDSPGQMGMTLGLAWRITGDNRYANKLRESLLLSLDNGLKAGPDAAGHMPPWHSWLGTAGLVVSCAVGREALEGFLSPAERQRITEGMMRLGILPILEDWVLPQHRIHALDSMGHNWWSVCVSGAGVGVLAVLGEEPRAVEWLDEIEKALAGFFDYRGMVLLNKTANFDQAGADYEGVHYAGYALESYLMFRLAWTNAVVTPPQPVPLLQRMAEFFGHTLYPASTDDLAINFGDSSLKPDAAPTMRLLAILGFSPELTRWYLQRLDRDSIDPLTFLYLNDSSINAHNSLPTSVIYPAIGWAALRNSWDDNATLLGVKCGFTWNHAHADAGSFVLFHAGRPLLIDSGKCDYNRGEYLDYYCQSRAHNVVLFTGQGQPLEDFHARGVKFPGQVHDLIEGMNLKYIYADATGPMARYFTRNYRHWLWIDDVILIFDDILANENGRVDWLLHYAGAAKTSGAMVELTNGPARAVLTMLHPANPIIQVEAGLAADAPDDRIKYLKFSTPASVREHKFMVVIAPQPDDPTSFPPPVELLQEPDALGVRITGKDQITEVYLNLQSDGRRMHLNSNNIIDGWETDAYFLALTRPTGTTTDIEHVTRFFVTGCSYLRQNGQTALDSLSKVSAVFQPGMNTEILLHGQPHTEVAVIGFQKPNQLTVNRQPKPFKYQPGQRTLRFQCDLT